LISAWAASILVSAVTPSEEVRVAARRVRLAVGAVAAVLAGCGGGSGSPIGPGDEIGTMTLAVGTVSDADLKFFDRCDPVILKPGDYMRSCAVPRVNRLFVGYGDFEPTRKAIELDSKQSKWDLWIDGHRVDLAAFGTSDRTLFGFPAAGGKNVILREWRVILVGVTSGEHTIRYRKRHASDGTTDATWTFTVPES
jgi:hypothetical protein